MKAAIRAELERKRVLPFPVPTDAASTQPDLEQAYWTPEKTARVFSVSVQTVKMWMQKLYPPGQKHEDLFRWGNRTTTPSLRRYITERYTPPQ